ncbi:unnamed protein product [Protopolystoma xenopodis]|uniref:Ion transport domain-containing protein n=1 Tax=Protopolystoma xenopodis TaxID=117903 RepID=A0A448XCM7_9PLAT|nr:unnamed protein product [Protopolystoma xenopodis]
MFVVSLVFVTIFTFVAETHSSFQVSIPDTGRHVNPEEARTNSALPSSSFHASLASLHSTLDLDSYSRTTPSSSVVPRQLAEDNNFSESSLDSNELLARLHAVNHDLVASLLHRASKAGQAQLEPTQMMMAWPGLEIIDYTCAVFFTIDLALRFYASPQRLHFIQSPVTLVELLAVVPYYADFILHLPLKLHGSPSHGDEEASRLGSPGPADAGNVSLPHLPRLRKFVDLVHVFRIFGILRLLKVLRYYAGLQVLIYTLRSSFKDLMLMLTFISVATLIFASLIYFADDPQIFTSIPAACWWAVVTITTVGYGDYYPRYPAGCFIGAACALVGVLVVAFTVPILVNSFMLYYSYADSLNSEKGLRTSDHCCSARAPDNYCRARLSHLRLVNSREEIQLDHHRSLKPREI